jgi:RHS repeat-associated protein
VGYTYDKAGNLVSRASTSYTYDGQDHLVAVNQAGAVTRFVYNGDGNLAQRIDPSGTVTDYVGDTYEKNLASGQETKRYMLGGTLIATSGGYLYADYLRSVVGASTGATVEYTPYGLYRNSTGVLPTDHQYQEQQNQAGIGLYHMGARWYDPTIGVWTQPDTIVPDPTDPLALNRYSFVEGNPLRYRDPSGHSNEAACQDPTGCPSQTLSSIAPASSNNDTPPNGEQGCSPDLPCNIITVPSDEYAAFLELLSEQGIEVGGAWAGASVVTLSAARGGNKPSQPSLPGSESSETSGNSDLGPLKARVDELHRLLGRVAGKMRTTAIVRAVRPDGSVVDIVASSEKRLDPEQRLALKTNEGEIEALTGLKGHAEDKALTTAELHGYQPLEVAASRDICPDCAAEGASQGAIPVSPLE